MMLSLTLSLPQPCASLRRDSFPCRPPHLTSYRHQTDKLCPLFNTNHLSNNLVFHPLGFSPKHQQLKRNKRGSGAVCYSTSVNHQTLRWVYTAALAVLAVTKGTAIQKSFLVPLFALQAPSTLVAWIKSEYGSWTAFLALLVRLFFFIPGDLELPFMALLLVFVAPHQVMNLRETKGGVVASLMIAAYLAYQHFSRAGSLRRAFDQGSIIPTLTVKCIAAIPFLLLICF